MRFTRLYALAMGKQRDHAAFTCSFVLLSSGNVIHDSQLQSRAAAMNSRRVGVDDVDERRLQRSAADKETVDIGLLGKLAAVLLVDAAAVQDAGLLRSLGRDLLLQPLADGGVDLLSLLGGSHLAGADGPGSCQCLLERCVVVFETHQMGS